jgi:hypothetical protein
MNLHLLDGDPIMKCENFSFLAIKKKAEKSSKKRPKKSNLQSKRQSIVVGAQHAGGLFNPYW